MKAPLFDKRNKMFFLVLLGCFSFFSCGLDEYPYITAPTQINHQPDCSSSDFTQNYFDFNSSDSNIPEGYRYLGTQIFYRIYNRKSSLTSDTSYLNNIAASDNNSSSADKMISNYKYKNLCYGSTAQFISVTSNNEVFIRLTDYLFSDDYKASVKFGDENKGIPLRNISTGSGSFNFGRKSSTGLSMAPVKGDEDFNCSDTPDEEGKYYVAMYAVAVGRDSTFQTFYSNILYLGSVTIDGKSENN